MPLLGPTRHGDSHAKNGTLFMAEAITGSTRAARRAGIQQAIAAVSRSGKVMAARVAGSYAVTPTISVLMSADE